MSTANSNPISPCISIVLPTYNQAEYLTLALDSIFRQTRQDFELIVVNDGSTDDTPGVLEWYQRQFDFTVISQRNQKLPRALNAGFERAQGEYLTWTSSDNIMLPAMLETLAAALEKHHDVGMVYADWEVIDEHDQSLGVVRTLEHDRHILMRVNYVRACFLYRRACQEAVGLYDPAYILAEDWEYWWRIANHFRMRRVPQVLYQYRVHSKSLTETDVRIQGERLGSSVGYIKLHEQFRARRWDWYYSKIKWEWLRMRRGHDPLRLQAAR